MGFSELMGYMSIASWLGAQFPQVLENMRRKSCEGLALPFLLNWLMGDMSNLIGCLLTHQLPFQTYLAIYFCSVDCILLGQYFYYGGGKSHPQQHKHTRSRTTSIAGRASSERGALHYRALSTVAANVAVVAALAAQQDEPEDVRSGRYHDRSTDELHESLTHPSHQEPPADEADNELSALTGSFHSEMGRVSGKRVSWSQERRRGNSVGHGQASFLPPTLQITAPRDASSSARGRSLRREVDSNDEEEQTEERRSSAHRTSSRASRRGAGMVFLGVWGLFGVGTLARRQYTSWPEKSGDVGRVLSADADYVSFIPGTEGYDGAYAGVTSTPSNSVHVVFPSTPSGTSGFSQVTLKEEPANKRIIGRIFAWLCTVLYLTSRLPQIWKNYARKSVEGLSMFLFVCAFLGNFFYVVSILTSSSMFLPPPGPTDFLKETIPYLLGSGGTFMFDVTIVSQFYIYRLRPRSRGRRNSVRDSEEAAGLLASDSALADSCDHNQNPGVIPHPRSRTSDTNADS
ncbi:hypothetical protein SERLA73DRAFT_172182 [Serpula lacrymans var. lacrymans S7.3]|uniref:PQ-loop-domain-containing protein n=2 Tax=Serpula lacrymans var. lacrymans TaxID=341189 RepID=F8QEK7_SERL3|nr:uncharacterized protein SERLADRAFT_443983 [Serpula lacrymans var. lacrymans S7.9]EGN93263.1 hypothetical protein SERLA73DRAFT_172182 [Serpula lacrymans var. lacrymans S7.3]EGO18646.1 hypothetical protein SERLADRAFT_443983 [Serpula lacrymans var. lacrymans S7.9]